MQCTRHRVFLATLIVASKYLNDVSLKNKHWRAYAVLFDLSEINLMEKQLLYLLEYDLRFDELEACKHFAPFMGANVSIVNHKRQAELGATTRAEAIDRVSKAGRARAKARIQLPPPLPATSTLASTVRNIAKRLSTTHLPLRPPSSQSLESHHLPIMDGGSTSSDSTSGSEMGSLLEDNGFSSSSSEFTSEDEGESNEEDTHLQLPNKKFVIQPMPIPAPAFAYRQRRTRKVSDTSSIRSTCTIKNQTIVHSPTNSRRTTASKRVSSLGYGSLHSGEAGKQLASSATMPTIAHGRQTGSVGFLSRMWGVAKGHVPEKEADPIESNGGSALRRLVLVHSRSAVFRGSGDA
jgi:PHO85 cyclin-1